MKLVDLTLAVRHETDAAYLFGYGNVEAWVPKSVVERNADGTFTMPQDIAEEKGLV